MINQEILRALMERGVKVTQRMSDVIEEADDLRVVDSKLMVVAGIMYAAGLAQSTNLDLESFTTLCIHAYRNVDVEIPKKPTIDVVS